jgi:hypothetical protein
VAVWSRTPAASVESVVHLALMEKTWVRSGERMQGRLCPGASCPRLTMLTPRVRRPCPFRAKERGRCSARAHQGESGSVAAMRDMEGDGLASSDRVQQRYSS